MVSIANKFKFVNANIPFLILFAIITGLLMPERSWAQATFPTTASGVRAAGVVPLQCDASAANCAPASATNPVIIATGTAVSPVDNIGNSSFGIRSYSNTGATGAAFTLPYLWNGGSWDRTRGDANGLVVQPGLTATFWSYTSGVTPILSNTTTGVTIKAAAGASARNYIDSCQLTTTAFGASVPLALRDGTGGTVRWALIVPTAGFLQPVTVNFSPALQGTTNTLWEVATPTANTTGTVTLNCAGHTGI